ncbi:MAG: phosphate acetyltransferase [candidate division KSB1 bacterium]|nr:phosphate acetyltransferase [candidate division KSB1 bacterium]MDZ7274457.1 phosphate acetyltransferase [candidate division KSB1 bacterium]MDZ7284881.1 phosphate acetyltransferase [candidate division KSB1 bacterium]MDZ7297698.1 phosphate acetyltransferase [candidate division KSB1 bacterium]MDZ7305878.1 phosphate acetyltransferase [candidate division KSB1 bacterium]
MTFLESLAARARQQPRRLVFPEATEARTLQAVAELHRRRLAVPVLIGDPQQVQAAARELGLALADIEIIDPCRHPQLEAWADELRQRQVHKPLSQQQALARLQNPLYFAAAYVRAGLAAGTVAGAAAATAEVLRAALLCIGMAPGISLVSSVFLMVSPHNGRVLTFADCAVVPEPEAQQLAEIAVTAADTHRKLTGETPVVALLSFSTKGSATHAAVEKVRLATTIAQQLRPALALDGELQADAALVPEIAQRKAPDSIVRGNANVLIFPDLNAGNIAYKLVQRLAGYQAIGPILQGLAKPANDLSRGCMVEDIVNVACICSIMAGEAF